MRLVPVKTCFSGGVVNPRQIYRRDRQEFDAFAQHLSDIILAVIPRMGNNLSLGDI